MIRALSIAAALSLAPLASALAQDAPAAASTADAEAAIEAAAEAFEARMGEFERRASVIEADESLSPEAREIALAALWAEAEPEIAAFTADITSRAMALAADAMANLDIDALIGTALSQTAVVGAGLATNGAWASNDPEHMQTYGLIADYALGQVEDAVDDAPAEPLSAD